MANPILDPADRLDLKAVARRAGVHLNTATRWAISGVRGSRLRTVRIGGRRFTCEAWYREFLAALNDTAPPPTERPNVIEACRRAGV